MKMYIEELQLGKKCNLPLLQLIKLKKLPRRTKKRLYETLVVVPKHSRYR